MHAVEGEASSPPGPSPNEETAISCVLGVPMELEGCGDERLASGAGVLTLTVWWLALAFDGQVQRYLPGGRECAAASSPVRTESPPAVPWVRDRH